MLRVLNADARTGEAQVNGQALGAGDAMKISGERKVRIDRARDAEVLLFDLDLGVQGAAAAMGQGDPTVVRLTGVYHNLLRQWADA